MARFTHRYSSHSDRSRGAIDAEWRGLESARHAGKRLKIGYELLSEVAREELDDSPEWHHMRVPHRGGAEEVDYRPPQEWNSVAEAARRVRREELRAAREERAELKRLRAAADEFVAARPGWSVREFRGVELLEVHDETGRWVGRWTARGLEV